MRAIAIAFLFAAACGGDDPGDETPDATTGAPDSGAPPDAAPPDERARLVGVIRRTATPQGDAVGDVYVALFDRDPVLDMANAELVGQVLLTRTDLSGAAATAAYAMDDIPPRAEDYYVVAFLDDNDSVDADDPADAGPDMGDLVSLDGLAAPSITISVTGDVTHDIVLNSVLPF